MKKTTKKIDHAELAIGNMHRATAAAGNAATCRQNAKGNATHGQRQAAEKNAALAEEWADKSFWAAMAAVEAMKAIAKADGRRNAQQAAANAKDALAAADEAMQDSDEAAYWVTQA